MNNFRVVFYGLAVVAAVCAGDARAADSQSTVPDGHNSHGNRRSYGDGVDWGSGKGRTSSVQFNLENLKKNGGNFVSENKFTLVAAVVSSLIVPEEEDALAALVDTAGASVDYYNLGFERRPCGRNTPVEKASYFDSKRDDILLQIGVFGVNVGVNYGIRKTGKYLNSNGISVKSCLGDSAVVKVSTDVIMHPELLTFLFWTTVGWLRGGN